MTNIKDSLIDKLDEYFLSDTCDALSTSTVTSIFDIIRKHTAAPDVVELLRDMRCNVDYTNVATMPIPLYERMKAAIAAMGDALVPTDRGAVTKNSVRAPSPTKYVDWKDYPGVALVQLEKAKELIEDFIKGDASTRKDEGYVDNGCVASMAPPHSLNSPANHIEDKLDMVASPSEILVDTLNGYQAQVSAKIFDAIQGYSTKKHADYYAQIAVDVLTPYLSTREPVSVPVSLEKCANAALNEAMKGFAGHKSIAKAVLDAAGVKYVE